MSLVMYWNIIRVALHPCGAPLKILNVTHLDTAIARWFTLDITQTVHDVSRTC